ncbi:MAG: N-carbamoylputrescine amidase [Opitutales bacterium]|jgi:N-carbamoylputrescine amidase
MKASETRVAALQLELNGTLDENLQRVESMVREGAAAGAEVILPPELFAGPYFCREEKEEFFATAYPLDAHPVLEAMQPLAAELGVVIPVSLFEREGQAHYNTVVLVDDSGRVMGSYRKSHIPDGPGYEEKFYFRPGNTGFKVWPTRFGTMGVGICWDQWFPECARSMVLKGADILLYPTAIGSEPEEPDLDTSGPWQRVMQGHAVANVVPVVAANRIGNEGGQVFYGHSFICDCYGEILAEAQPGEEKIIHATFDLAEVRLKRASMGFFRDRRPDLYGDLTES